MSTLGNNILMEYCRQSQNAMPTDGLVFYAPLDAYHEKTETNNYFVYPSSGWSFTTYNGIPCLEINAGNNLVIVSTENNELPLDSFTVCGWYNTSAYVNEWYGIRNKVGTIGYSIGESYSKLGWSRNGVYFQCLSPQNNAWYHIALCVPGASGIRKFFVDGALSSEQEDTWNNAGYSNFHFSASYQISRFAGVRVYNRVLTQTEIQTLANEFTPTP